MLYEEKLEWYMQKYILDYGQKKFLAITEKLLTSNSVRRFLINEAAVNSPPTYLDIVSTVMNVPYFGFGKKTTVAMASLMLLQTWNEEINKKKLLLHDLELCLLFDQIEKKCMGML